jgi:hypothetical protein
MCAEDWNALQELMDASAMLLLVLPWLRHLR